MQLSRSTADRLDEFSYFVAHYREAFYRYANSNGFGYISKWVCKCYR